MMTISLPQLLRLIILLLLTVGLVTGTAQPAAAHEHADRDTPVDYSASWPPLPERSPRVGPDLTFGYHDHVTLPAELRSPTEKWIDVDLSEQRVVAYEGARPVRAFIVSTGLPGYQTRPGTFRIWTKTRVQTMDGPNPAAPDYYYLPNVEWVQYFDGEIAFHGAYWHDNFGTPMSRGCVNMRNVDAQWLFEWAGPWYEPDGPAWQMPDAENEGTLVVVHE